MQSGNAYIMVSALILLICALRYSVIGAVLKHINTYIIVNALVPVQCVILHSFKRAV